MPDKYTLTNYDPRLPAFYATKDIQEWYLGPQHAKVNHYEDQQNIYLHAEDLKRMPKSLLNGLFFDSNIVTEEYDLLWQWLRESFPFKAPGREEDGYTPAELEENPVPAPRSTVRTRNHGLTVHKAALAEFTGPKQAMMIAAWLADQHDGQRLDDLAFERSIDLMQRVNPIKTRQSAWLVFKYYRPQLIKCRGLTE